MTYQPPIAMPSSPQQVLNIVEKLLDYQLLLWKGIGSSSDLAQFAPVGLPVRIHKKTDAPRPHYHANNTLGIMKEELNLEACCDILQHMANAIIALIKEQPNPVRSDVAAAGEATITCVVCDYIPTNFKHIVQDKEGKEAGYITFISSETLEGNKWQYINMKVVVTKTMKGRTERLFKVHQILCFMMNGFNTESQTCADHFICDNKHCVMPTHLKWSTHKGNGADRKKRKSEAASKRERDPKGRFIAKTKKGEGEAIGGGKRSPTARKRGGESPTQPQHEAFRIYKERLEEAATPIQQRLLGLKDTAHILSSHLPHM